MFISITSIKGFSTVELKHNGEYAIACGKCRGGFLILVLIKAILKLKFGRYYGKAISFIQRKMQVLRLRSEQYYFQIRINKLSKRIQTLQGTAQVKAEE